MSAAQWRCLKDGTCVQNEEAWTPGGYVDKASCEAECSVISKPDNGRQRGLVVGPSGSSSSPPPPPQSDSSSSTKSATLSHFSVSEVVRERGGDKFSSSDSSKNKRCIVVCPRS